jgi:hypothetical protein
MHRGTLLAMSVGALALPTLAATATSAEVTPTQLDDLRKNADAAYKASLPKPPTKTPEQAEAEKKAIKSHCDALFARMAERDSRLPANCD